MRFEKSMRVGFFASATVIANDHYEMQNTNNGVPFVERRVGTCTVIHSKGSGVLVYK